MYSCKIYEKSIQTDIHTFRFNTIHVKSRLYTNIMLNTNKYTHV